MRLHVLVGLALLGAASPPVSARPAPRPVGTVVGTLRHKGCPTAPVGAHVSVIGRDAGAQADADGRFALSLPPGVYSLVISGPGLVPDQRVDEVLVPSGQTHDLGPVEVWPEERPAGCTAAVPPAASPEGVVATAPDTPAVDLPGAAVAPASVSADQVWVRAGGGAAPGQFGFQGSPSRDDEDALGPPTFAVGQGGMLWVFDALNGRVQRFDTRGKLVGSFAAGRRGEDAVVESDLAVSDEEHVFLFVEGDPATLLQLDASGRTLVNASLPSSFRGVDLLFTARQRPVFLMLNGQTVRAELSWGGVRPDGPWPGLPAGDLFARADRVDRWRAAVKLAAADGRVRRSVQLHSRVPISGVRLVGVDRRGDVVVALDRAEPAEGDAPPRAEVLLIAVDAHGHLAGSVAVPPGNRRFEFREFALHPDGAVVQMQSDAAEVRFVRWTLRPPPKDAVAGEGLVRGRVMDAGRPGAGATVAVPRLRRTVPVAPDGTFELRLPAGNWVVNVRRGGPSNPGDPWPVDLRVAVAAGA
ncbi:MAG TPA: carboxypeptidase regulatory-like domain-containing protein, partial [Anaeromyxobacteraceae bacterium]|nr:carboxypeptidase regulatory-like domain-containing protein [Anaeromyxobacteraceae bacterium]